MASYILIGPMGVGKTTIGRGLAQELSLDFNDTDELIEARVGKPIGDIFVEDGEEFFREVELQVVLEACPKSGVLSLGGGACLAPQAQSAIKSSEAQVIFLDISLSEVSKRVGFDKARPLLAINPRSQWQSLMDIRKPIYTRLASQHLVVDGKSSHEIISEILGADKGN